MINTYTKYVDFKLNQACLCPQQSIFTVRPKPRTQTVDFLDRRCLIYYHVALLLKWLIDKYLDGNTCMSCKIVEHAR